MLSSWVLLGHQDELHLFCFPVWRGTSTKARLVHGKDLLYRKVRKHIMEIKKALILWVSRDQSKPWSGLGVSTTSRLGKGLRSLLGRLGFGGHLHRGRLGGSRLGWWRWRRCSRHHWSRSRHVLGRCREISRRRDFALALALFVSNSSEGSFLHCWLINCHLGV